MLTFVFYEYFPPSTLPSRRPRRTSPWTGARLTLAWPPRFTRTFTPRRSSTTTKTSTRCESGAVPVVAVVSRVGISCHRTSFCFIPWCLFIVHKGRKSLGVKLGGTSREEGVQKGRFEFLFVIMLLCGYVSFIFQKILVTLFFQSTHQNTCFFACILVFRCCFFVKKNG